MGNRNPQFPVSRTARQQDRLQEHYDRLRPEDNSKQPSRYGVITRVVEGLDTSTGRSVIRVAIRFDDALPKKLASSYGRLFILANTVDEIATLYGDDITGQRVRVDFTGSRLDQGIAHIDNPLGRGSIEKMSNLPGFGALMAPAGKGE